MNEHEKRAKLEIATLELLGALKALTEAHEHLMVRHFDRAREAVTEIIKHAKEVMRFIPEEPGE